MSGSEVSLLFAGITCIIGVMTFVIGIATRAKNDGVLVQKINQAIDGIEDLKSDIKSITSSQQELALLVQSHGEQIKTLYRVYRTDEANTQAILSMTEVFKTLVDNIREKRGMS